MSSPSLPDKTGEHQSFGHRGWPASCHPGPGVDHHSTLPGQGQPVPGPGLVGLDGGGGGAGIQDMLCVRCRESMNKLGRVHRKR